MSLPSISVKRPVTVTMVFLGIVLLGIISLSRLPQELFPPITYPQLTVVTNYPNAAPEEVETLITKLIEEAVGTVKNARRIISTSREGSSIVIVEFNWGTDMNFAALGMREKIDLIKERLPRDAEEPIVMKFNPFALPIMTLSISGERSLNELYEISRRYIKDRLEKIEGVASCNISGGIEREIQVDMNSASLYNSGIDLLAIVNSLQDSNLNYPAGTTKEEFFEWLVRTIGEFNAVSEIDRTVIALDERRLADYPSYKLPQEEKLIKERRLIKLSDVATVKDGFKERTSFSRYNGKENVSISIQKQAEANTIRTVQKVLKELKKIEDILPERVIINTVYDQSKFIKNAINNVVDAAIQGGILAFLVLLIFLRNFKNSLIVAFSIPISIMAAFSLMYFAGISINMISLGGLALGIGMLVDNAIVVIENIFQNRQLGKSQKEAAIVGTEEVNNAITASTLTTVAVFLPMIFVVGIAGQIFKQLAFTVTISLVASLFVALSLIPRLAMTGREKTERTFVSSMKRVSSQSAGLYSRILIRFLARKGSGLFIIFCIFIASLTLFFLIGKEFMPKVDEGQFMVRVDMPPGTKLDVTNNISERIEQQLPSMEDVKNVSATAGSSKEEISGTGSVEMLKDNQAQIVVNLKESRRQSTDVFIQNLKKRLDEIDLEGAEIKFILSQTAILTAFQEEATPIVIEIKGENLDELMAVSESVMEGVSNIQGIFDVKSNMERPAPETKLVVNKDKAALYNVSVKDIARTAQIAINGWIATRFKEEGKEIDVRVRLREQDRKDFSVIKKIRIISPDGIEVPLEEVADFKPGRGPSEIKRIDKERTILVYANIFGRKINEIIQEIPAYLNGVKVPAGYAKPNLTGEREQMSESFKSLQFALILAILLVYMIMAAQFESFWQPFIIMFTVPLSVIGVALALFITGKTLNVVVILGIIMLGGIVVNNGILLIDCINSLMKKGKETFEAVVEAAKVRLRPILMTSLTTVLGLLPLALGIGEGAELRSPLAVTVMGGLLVSTFLTLVVIPSVYLIVSNLLLKSRK